MNKRFISLRFAAAVAAVLLASKPTSLCRNCGACERGFSRESAGASGRTAAQD